MNIIKTTGTPLKFFNCIHIFIHFVQGTAGLISVHTHYKQIHTLNTIC